MWLHPDLMQGGGNFYGVCHGLDQGGKFYNQALIPRFIMQSLGFILEIKETPGCVLKTSDQNIFL